MKLFWTEDRKDYSVKIYLSEFIFEVYLFDFRSEQIVSRDFVLCLEL